MVLDESQYIKNPDSKIYRAVTGLNARYKLILTGTPIENSLNDLWAQLNFLNEGLLGNITFFRNEFVFPIERRGDEQQQEKLKTLIQPFILRRTKDQVANDLPLLTEQIINCEMTDEQGSYYESEKSRIRNAILDLVEENKIDNAGFIVLNGLNKLRQIANHPVLIDEDYIDKSGKFEEVTQFVNSLVLENHKVLIFSSFVKHLELFADYFQYQEWDYSMLTGKTQNREKVISEFQDNPDNRLFLISLKAGGVGLNLTAADYVVILDPWWNPATENQAISRAHRIGQDKKVFVYRFITRNTLEHKIQVLKKKKTALADVFINTNNPFKNIPFETVINLFE